MTKQRTTIFSKYIVISLLAITPLLTFAQEKGVVIDKIIAKVDDYIVLKSDLEKAYLNQLSRGQFRGSNAKCELLEQLVVNKMLVAKAEIDSVEVADVEVQSELSRRMSYMTSQIGSEEEIENFYGKTLKQIQTNLFPEVKEQLTIRKMQQSIISDLKVSPAEVKKFFNLIPRDSLPFFSTEVIVGQIVKNPTPGKKQKEDVKKLMFEIRGKILRGDDF
ncbi:MAG: peptidylprolyl isomerase, partial [Marinoscillum sp.]